MKLDRKNQIPDILVFGVLYAVVFGISIWLLAFKPESPTNWILYPLLAFAVLAAVVKFALHSRAIRQRSA
jgi:membrane protein YdbS with pleckstrin-like domain